MSSPTFTRSQIVRFIAPFVNEDIVVPTTTRAKVVHEKNGQVKVTIHDATQKAISGQKFYVPANLLTNVPLGRPKTA
jgi:hypothetical protein